MIISPANRTKDVREYYFSRKLKEIGAINADHEAKGQNRIINLLGKIFNVYNLIAKRSSFNGKLKRKIKMFSLNFNRTDGFILLHIKNFAAFLRD